MNNRRTTELPSTGDGRRCGWSRGGNSPLALGMLLLVAGCSFRSDNAEPPRAETSLGPVRLEAAVDRATARIAEPIEFTLALTAPEGVEVNWPEPAPKLGEFAVIESEKRVDALSGSLRLWTRSYVLESYHAGRLTIPAVHVNLEGPGITPSSPDLKGRQNTTLQSAPLPVRIQSAVGWFAVPGRIYDIEDIVSLPRGWIYWTLRVAFALVVTISLAWCGWYIYRRFVYRPPTAEQWASAALERLDWQRLKQRWDAERSLDALIATVRQYLERRLGISPSQATTPELLAAARDEWGLDSETRATLGRLLETADRVKFARFEATVGLAREAFDLARTLVRQSSSAPTPATALARREVQP